MHIQVDVTVTDSNDQTPMFQGPLSFTLSEQSVMGTLVGTLAASDGDIGTNAVFSFSASASAPFTVQANGMWGVGHCGGDWGGGHMGRHGGGRGTVGG